MTAGKDSRPPNVKPHGLHAARVNSLKRRHQAANNRRSADKVARQPGRVMPVSGSPFVQFGTVSVLSFPYQPCGMAYTWPRNAEYILLSLSVCSTSYLVKEIRTA